jgi:hypothetical protein
VKDIFKQQILKEPKLLQFDKVLYMWLTAVPPQGKPMTGLMLVGKAKSFHDEIKIKNVHSLRAVTKNYVIT